MKNIIFVIVACMIVLGSCTGIKSTTSGVSNDAFIEIVGTPDNYPNGVTVSVDEKITFQAEVNDIKMVRPKGKVYTVAPGTHVIKVVFNQTLLYQQQVFLSAQETRKIELK